MDKNTDKLDKSFQKYFDSLDNQELSGEENKLMIKNVVNEYKISAQERKLSILEQFKHKIQVSYSYRQSFYKTAIAATVVLFILAGSYFLYRDYYNVPKRTTELTSNKKIQTEKPVVQGYVQKEITISKSVELAYIPLKLKSYGFSEKLKKEKTNDKELIQRAFNIAKRILTNSNVNIVSINDKEIVTSWNYYNVDGRRKDSRLRVKLINHDKLRLSFYQEESVLSSENMKLSKLIDASLYKEIIKNIKKDYYDFLENK